MRVFLSAGEASGDAYGAFLAREMRRLGATALEYEGIGGKLMRQEGIQIVLDSSDWGAVGIAQALKMLPKVGLAFQRAKKSIQSGKPGLLVAIDFGFFNIRLCRAAKAAGWKVLYFIPPGSWRRDRQGSDLPGVTDAITTPFSWSAEILRGMGADAHWFGHPIRQLVESSPAASEIRGNTITILPGSRKHEIHLNLPLIAEALKDRDEVFEFVVAPSVDRDALESLWKSYAPGRKDAFLTGDKYGVLRRAKAAVVCSGTATLETALCGCPMVVLYKITALMHLQGYLMGMKVTDWVSLPNIFLQRALLPELLGWKVQPESLRTTLAAVLENPEPQLAGFSELETMLGGEHAITGTAEIALALCAT